MEGLDFEVAMLDHDQAPYDRIAMDWFQEEAVSKGYFCDALLSSQMKLCFKLQLLPHRSYCLRFLVHRDGVAAFVFLFLNPGMYHAAISSKMSKSYYQGYASR